MQQPPELSRHDRRFALGAVLWICCLQFFVFERIGILAWQGHYSLSQNVISDLGALGCSLTGPHPICSPLHAVMNASFVAQGFLISGGAALMWPGRRSGMGPGLCLAGLAGPGVTLVGLFPENTIYALHYFGAAENFGLLTLAAFAFALTFARRNAPLRAAVSLLVAILGTTGMILLAQHEYLGFGEGAVERLVAYPLPLYLAFLGMGFLREGRDKIETPPAARP